ncbi:MAG: hypothetical protein D6753_12440 [Planctomycetota bacterium]|nr:MAG: hypothetical protein D6753_12440 [Planctomycetota bacterium]
MKDQKAWPELEILAADNQQQVLAAIQEMAGWSAYQEERDRRAAELRRTADLELRLTKMERLRFLLESIVLDRNFPKVAPAEACELLNRIRALEQSSLGDAELARSRDRTPSDSDLGSKSSE